MSIKVGVASGTWGIGPVNISGQVPWNVFLDETRLAGYKYIEAGHYGYLPTDPKTLLDELTKRDIKVVASTVMNGHLDKPSDWPSVKSELMVAGNVGASLNAKYIVLIDDFYSSDNRDGETTDKTLTADGWKHLIETTHRIADIAKEEFGLDIAFHSHADTHVETTEQLEKFLEDTDSDKISLCLDTGHLHYGGGDSLEFMKKHHKRVSYMHFKDVNTNIWERVKSENLSIQEATAMGVFCDLGEGNVNYPELGKVLNDIEYSGWVIVEQDVATPVTKSPLKAATKARKYLESVGIG